MTKRSITLTTTVNEDEYNAIFSQVTASDRQRLSDAAILRQLLLANKHLRKVIKTFSTLTDNLREQQATINQMQIELEDLVTQSIADDYGLTRYQLDHIIENIDEYVDNDESPFPIKLQSYSIDNLNRQNKA